MLNSPHVSDRVYVIIYSPTNKFYMILGQGNLAGFDCETYNFKWKYSQSKFFNNWSISIKMLFQWSIIVQLKKAVRLD
jgi:hypothetical protein